MSRIPQSKTKLSNAGEPNNTLHSAAIFKVRADSDGRIFKTDNFGIFQLNPSTWEESKSSNWSPHSVPGQSDPIYQWVSGGPRTVRFEALVTKDHSTNFLKGTGSVNAMADSLGRTIDVVGDIASAFAGVEVPPLGDLFGGAEQGKGTQLSIAPELNYYRSLMYPEYESGVLSSSPPLVVLQVGETLSRIPIGSRISFDNNQGATIPIWIVTNLGIRITKQLPNLDPMEAMVSFELNEYMLAPRRGSKFGTEPDNSDSTAGGIIALWK